MANPQTKIKQFTSIVTLTLNKVQQLISNGSFHQTLKLYKTQIHPLERHHTHIILPSVIKTSSSPHLLHFGLQLHSLTLKTASIFDTVVANSLLTMYSKCSRVDSASRLFDTMPVRDTVTWNSMINCYLQNGYATDAIKTLGRMCLIGLWPKPELVASVVSVCCGRRGEFRLGRQIHARVVTNGDIDDSQCGYLSTALLDMYSRCFDLKAAFEIFKCIKNRNEVSWTAMIAGCNTNQCYSISLDLFRAMLVDEGNEIKPNRVTLTTVLQSCDEVRSLEHGKQIHGYAVRCRYESESQVAAALIEMYCKCGGAMRAAMDVFRRAERRDVVMWSSMIGNYSKRGDDNNAVKLFNQMRMEGIDPNSVTMLAVITRYSADQGQAVHGYIVKSGFDSNLHVGNSLIDMYAKCGLLHATQQIFNEIPVRDLLSWNALIRGYGLHGRGAKALQLFKEMQENEIEPDEITFLAVLSACSHCGIVDEGVKLFEQMQRDNKIILTVEHYSCYIDLLGRSGNIEDACKVVTEMPMKTCPAIWSSLISACKVHGRLDVAKQLVHQLIDSEPDNPANYTLASMVYSEIKDWCGTEEVQRVMKQRGLQKRSGYSRLDPDFLGRDQQ